MRYVVRNYFHVFFIFFCIAAQHTTTFANDFMTLDDALRSTYTACVGIDSELSELKKLAGINTAVTAVGAATGAGATIVGLVKSQKDKQIADLEIILEPVRETPAGSTPMFNDKERANQDIKLALKNTSGITDSEIAKLTNQSKKLGNWRTGLMAGATATNIAGTVLAGAATSKGDIQDKINTCINSLSNLRNSIGRAYADGVDVSEAQKILSECSRYENQDISKIQKHAKSAMVSSLVGTATGATGTITSAVANTDKTRNDDTDSGKKKEKDLNAASNVLAGMTTVASATATIFNAMEIKAIKRIAEIAVACEWVLIQ